MNNEMIVTISKGQQITLPAEIRNLLGLDIGSRLEVEEDKGIVKLKPIGEDIEALFKKAKNIKQQHKLNVKELEELNEKRFR